MKFHSFGLFFFSYVLTGTEKGMNETFGTTCHGAVRITHELLNVLIEVKVKESEL